jgi:hypothetical protein
MLDVLFLVYWAWTDANAAKMATDQLLSPITSGVRAILLSALAKLKCEGESPMGMVQLAFRLGCKPGTKRPAFLPPLLYNCGAFLSYDVEACLWCHRMVLQFQQPRRV